jgi:hypothetical protein
MNGKHGGPPPERFLAYGEGQGRPLCARCGPQTRKVMVFTKRRLRLSLCAWCTLDVLRAEGRLSNRHTRTEHAR